MVMHHLVWTGTNRPSLVSRRPDRLPGSRRATHDPRWPVLDGALRELRAKGRCAIRIVDADCGVGALLLRAALHARTLGFAAIEARGIDGSSALIGRARAAAARAPDPAIGISFDVADVAVALAEEVEAPADIVLWHGARERDQVTGLMNALRRAGDLVISDDGSAVVVRPSSC
jgi:SAM-dependent methyltransferase